MTKHITNWSHIYNTDVTLLLHKPYLCCKDISKNIILFIKTD